MKKLLSLVLCLMLALSAWAMAETATTVDFGAFTMALNANDQYEMAPTMVDNQLYAIVYVDYDPNATFTKSINIIWSASDLKAEINQLGGMDRYAALVMENAKSQYGDIGITATNASLLGTETYENYATSITTYTLDYTGAGVDLVTDLYQKQVLFFNSTDDNYIFTLTADTMEALEAMTAYLDTVTFKNAPETTNDDSSTVDFGAFTMVVGAGDHYEVADTMASNAVYLIMYPDYYTTGQTTNNINVVYTKDNLAMQLLLTGGIEKYAELVLQQSAPQYEAMGIKMSDAQVLYTLHEGDEAAIITSSTLDYSGAGVDLVLTLYQMIGMFMDTPSGDFIFTITADSMESLAELITRLDTVKFK